MPGHIDEPDALDDAEGSAQYGQNPSIQPSKLCFSGCIDGRGPYCWPLMASSVLLSIVYQYSFVPFLYYTLV